MPEHCLPQVQAVAMRVTALDISGVPLPGTDTMIISNALTSLAVSPVYTDGDEIEEKGANGGVCVNYRSADTFKRLDVTITLCTPDPYLEAALSGGDVLEAGGLVGFASPPLGIVTGNGVSIELWALRIDNGALDVDSPYAWYVYPRVQNLRLGDFTHQNGAILPVFSGQAVENPNWYDGPGNDWPATSDRVSQWIETSALPTVACGYTELVAS